MRTASVEYEDINIEFARPSIMAGQVRKAMWREYSRLTNDDPLLKRYTTVFACILTQLVSSENFPFEKVTACPDDETLMSELTRFMEVTDEMLCEKIETKIAELNGYTKSTIAEKKRIVELVREYVGKGGPNPDPLSEDAPESLDPRLLFPADDDEVRRAYYFADRFGWPPDVVDRQDEAVMDSLMLMDRQVNWKKWAQAHDADGDEYESDERTPNYRDAF